MIRDILSKGLESCPLDLLNFNVELFFEWLVSLASDSSSMLSKSTYSTHRAALFNFSRSYGVPIRKKLQRDLSDFYNELKRDIATSVQKGNGKITEGRRPVGF